MDILIAISIFASVFCSDYMYGIYTNSVVANKALKTGAASAAIHIITAWSVINFTQNWKYLIFSVSGGFCGSFAVVTLAARREQKNKHDILKNI